ncbi:type II toxin-antitoxin system ParD family antitoxin [Rhizorhabdus wittichii]|uniref:type II toxin-antitoxin system ParD family antitoxin n=1 Tax=Rhizorhabdus wittichii TaxID=160791 RepID=UPI0002E51C0B|nr:type II toxin-antitoxin system ParD family antitoxin [Rhizorhabdus wittichii]
MAEIERLTIVVPEPMAAKIRAAVAAGEYASTSEVVRDAVRLWNDRREFRREEIAALRKAWDEGRASGNAGPLDMKALIDEARHEKSAQPRG